MIDDKLWNESRNWWHEKWPQTTPDKLSCELFDRYKEAVASGNDFSDPFELQKETNDQTRLG